MDADELLDEALRFKRIDGSTIGERLVSAQKKITDNDGTWKAHKLAEHVKSSPATVKLKKKDVQQALISYRKALRELEVFDG